MNIPCPECGETSKNMGRYFTASGDGPAKLQQMCLNHDCWKHTFTVLKEEVRA